jgi:hypothetical protein
MRSTSIERRAEPRTITDQYYSVNFSITRPPFVFHFLIWDKSSNGMSLLVKEDSVALNYLKVGETVAMKFYKTDSSKPAEFLKAKIRHITRDEQGRFRGHYLVGISILEAKDSDK